MLFYLFKLISIVSYFVNYLISKLLLEATLLHQGRQLLKNNIYKFFVSLADVVIVNSLTFKSEMEKKFKIKVNCIFNPLNKKEIISLSKKKINENFFRSKKMY